MDHMICGTSVYNPRIRFKHSPINYLSRKHKMRKIRRIQKRLPEKLEELEAELKEDEGNDDDDVCGKAEMASGVMIEAT